MFNRVHAELGLIEHLLDRFLRRYIAARTYIAP